MSDAARAMPCAEWLADVAIAHDMAEWLTAAPEAQLALVTRIAASTPGLRVAPPAAGGPPRLIHGATGARLCFIPGGTTVLGLSEQEQAALEDPAFLDTGAGEDAWDAGLMLALAAVAETTRPLRVTRFAPFLLAEEPLMPARALAFKLATGGAHARTPPDAPLQLEPRTIARVATGDLRLPTEAEWEHAVRAGTTTPFYWGRAPAAGAPKDWPAHPLGLARIGSSAEATQSPWWPGEGATDAGLGVVRGGGWPEGLVARRDTWRRGDVASRCAVRLAFSLVPIEASMQEATVAMAEMADNPPWVAPAAWVSQALTVLGDPAATPRDASLARARLWSRCGGSAIWTHQGINALAGLLRRGRGAVRVQDLVLAADLVCGDHTAVVGSGLDLKMPAIASMVAHPRAARMHTLVGEKREALMGLLTHDDAGVRGGAALVLGLSAGLATGDRDAGIMALSQALEVALSRELDRPTRAAILLALGHVTRFQAARPALGNVGSVGTGVDDPIEAGAGALAQILAARGLPPEVARDALRETLIAFIAAEPIGDARAAWPERFPWHYGQLAELTVKVLVQAGPDGVEVARDVLAGALVRGADDALSARWTQGLAQLDQGWI